MPSEYKKCIRCGHEFLRCDLSKQGFCQECSFERMERWWKLQREAYEKFRQVELDRFKKKIDDDSLKKLLGD